MPRQCCFLCASDEGVFLDITVDNEQVFHEQFEICSLVKVPTTDQLPTKICHKCAYELNQCSSFIQKYKRATKQKTSTRRHCCSLCREPAKNEFIFDVSKDKDLQRNLLDKVQQLLNYELGKSQEDHKFVCLSCRYTVDVLIDLQNICKESKINLNDVINEKTDYLTFPKIKTTVVSRKTTVTESGRINLCTLQESKNNITEMTRTRSQNNKLSNDKRNEKSKLRICGKCHTSVNTGDDMYKIHKTGSTVCKSCWKSTDVRKSETEKQVQQTVAETKECAVYLKDVLKDTEIKEKQLYRVDEDNEGNKTYVVIDKDLTTEKKSTKAASDTDNKTRKQGKKRSVKSMKTENENTNNEDTSNKKHKSDVSEVNNTKSQESEPVPQQLKQLRQKNASRNITRNSDSDSSISKTVTRSERALTRHKRATGSSLSDADIDNKHNRKKLRTILRGIPLMKNVDVSDESSSNEGVISKRKRIRFTSASSIIVDLTDDKSEESSEKNVPLRKTRNTIQKVTTTSATVTISQETQSSESEDKKDIFDTQTYVCDECGASYENKLMGLIHKLTHYKQPRLKLSKLSNESLAKKVSGLNEAVDDQSEDPSETIEITVEDDEEESVEDESNLDTNKHADASSDTESKTNSSKKEALEDAVDVELVMKESDDDQTHRTEKETEEELQADEDVEINIVSLSTRNKNEVEQRKDEQTKSENNYNNNDKADENIYGSTENENVNSEEKQNISHSDTADTREQYKDKNKEDNSESRVDDEEKENNVEQSKGEEKDDDIEQSKGEKKDDDIEQAKGEEKDDIEQSRGEKKDDEIEQAKSEEKDDDIEQAKDKEKNNIEQAEVEEKNDDIEQAKDAEKDTLNKDTKTSDKNEEEEKEEEEEQEEEEEEEEEEVVECIEQEIKTVNKKSLNKSSKDFDTNTVAEDEIDSSEKVEHNDIENKETENEVDVQFEHTATSKETIEQKSPKCTQKIRSSTDNGIEIEINDSDSKDSEVSEKIVLPEKSSTIDKDDDNISDVEILESTDSKQEKSRSDSANAAAEVLQEVLDLATAEVQKRQDIIHTNTENNSIEAETLENISREIHNTVDMPPLKIDDAKSENDTPVE